MYQYNIKSDKAQKTLRLSYSYRTGHRDQSSLPVPDAALSKESPTTLAGETSAILAYNSELGVSNNISSYDNFLNGDKGHAFARLIIGSRPMHGRFEKRYYNPVSLSGRNSNCFTDRLSASLFYLSPFSVTPNTLQGVGPTPAEFQSEAVDLLWDIYPGKFQGSLGQDLVDLAELPRILTKMRELKRLAEEFNSLPYHVKDAIDAAFRSAKSTREMVLKTSKVVPKSYLQWLFVFQPYVSDVQLLLKALSRASVGLYSAQRRRKASKETRGTYSTNDYSSFSPQSYKLVGNTLVNTSNYANWFASDVWYRYDLRVVAKFRNVRPTSNEWINRASDLNRQLGMFYPSLLWDLAPWSFVVDWFLHIGESIDRAWLLQEDKYPLDFAYATLKFDALTQFKLRSDVAFTVYEPVVAKATSSSLYRFPISLQDGRVPSWSGLSRDEKTILVALGLANSH